MRNEWLFLAAVALILFAVAGFILISVSRHHRAYGKSTYSSTGERIYYEAIGKDGKPIPFTGGPHWLAKMRYRGCVNCHGIYGKGGFPTPLMTSEVAADITYASLMSTEHHHDDEADKEEAPYTDETIKRAITQGIDSSGKKLSVVMPHWEMNEEELGEILAYLKKL